MMFGVIGKFSAVFISIPYPVLGGAAIIMFSTFLGVALSNLQVTSRIQIKYMYLVFLFHNLTICYGYSNNDLSDQSISVSICSKIWV